MRVCAGKDQRRIMDPLCDVDPVAPRVVRGHSGALPHGSAAGHGFGAALALPATFDFTDKRSPHCRSDQRERSGAAVRGGTPHRALGAMAALPLAAIVIKRGSGSAGDQRRHYRQRWRGRRAKALACRMLPSSHAALHTPKRQSASEYGASGDSHEHAGRVASSRTFNIAEPVASRTRFGTRWSRIAPEPR